MSYRIEISPNNRAGCKDGECKKQGLKLVKGEIRFGTWVEFNEHGSWQWRHWGCVSGKTVQNMREKIADDDGSYDFDKLDGYDELEDHPDVQTKIRRVIEQGHIDDADFNGDLAYNKLGQTGIRGRAKKAKPEGDDELASSPAKPSAKRGRKKADAEDDEDEEIVPKKKARKSDVKAETSGKKTIVKAEDSEEKPAPKARGKSASKVKKEESEAEEADKPAPVKKARGKKAAAPKVKDEEQDEPDQEEEEEKPAPAKKARSKKAIGKKVPAPPEDEDEEMEEPEEPAPKAKGKGGRKTKVSAAVNADSGASSASTKRSRAKKA